MHIIRTLLLCLLFAASHSQAASFDCGSELSKVEKTICDVGEISELDDVLVKTYKLVMDLAPNRGALRAEQRRWLTTVRNQCLNSECLLTAYAERVGALEAIWKKTTRASRASPDEKKPFEGRWEICQLFKGDEICSSYVLTQRGGRVCGEWEYWATYRIYSGQLQALTKNSNQAELTLICGTPGSETSTECDNNKPPHGSWQKAKGGLSICNGQLYDEPLKNSCSTLSRSPGFLYQPLNKKDREYLYSQEWLKKACLGDG